MVARKKAPPRVAQLPAAKRKAAKRSEPKQEAQTRTRAPAAERSRARIQLSLLSEPPEVSGKPSDECYTPASVLDPVSRLLGGIDTDPCWSPRSLVKPRLAGYTIADEGENQPWHGSAWVNPPYSDPDPFMRRAVEHAKEGNRVAVLVNVDPSTLWWERTYADKFGCPAHLTGLWPHRLTFLGEFAGGGTARSSSALFLWNVDETAALTELPRVLWYRRARLKHAEPTG